MSLTSPAKDQPDGRAPGRREGAGREVGRRATLQDVARACGLSTATVSRCLSRPDRVAATTRERVLGVVERLNYTPNFGGRALASRRTGTIGVVVPTLDNAIFARGLQAFTDRLREDGYTPLVASSNYDPQVEAEQIRTLAARGADGFLLIGTEREAGARRYLQSLGRPCVLAWCIGGAGDRYVGFDNRAAATALADHVLDEGHVRIAMIAGHTATNDRARDRLEGVRAALDVRGLNGAAMPVEEAPYTFEGAARAVDRLMASGAAPTAIICGNDVIAVGAISRLKTLGIDVPRRVSVTGFDDIELASVIDPALTTVHAPHRRMGSAAAELVVALLAGEERTNLVLETNVVRRASLAPPPSP